MNDLVSRCKASSIAFGAAKNLTMVVDEDVRFAIWNTVGIGFWVDHLSNIPTLLLDSLTDS